MGHLTTVEKAAYGIAVAISIPIDMIEFVLEARGLRVRLLCPEPPCMVARLRAAGNDLHAIKRKEGGEFLITGYTIPHNSTGFDEDRVRSRLKTGAQILED